MNRQAIVATRSAPRLSPGIRLQCAGDQDHVLLYRDGAAHLNASAALILSLCDGAHDTQAIVSELQRRRAPDAQTRPSSLANDVMDFLEAARRCGWLVDSRAGIHADP